MENCAEPGIDVSVVMPCLNEARAVGACITAARHALARLNDCHGLRGEIIIADNGSIDGSQHIARGLGARVVAVSKRGYGAALIGGSTPTRGRYLVMGKTDGPTISATRFRRSRCHQSAPGTGRTLLHGTISTADKLRHSAA